MKKIFLFIICSKAMFCLAQQTAFPANKITAPFSLYPKNALLVLKVENEPDITAFRFVEKRTYYAEYGALNPANIENVYIPRRDSAIKMYGNDAINGAVIFYLKHKIQNQFLSLDELLTAYKVDEKDRQLVVLIDSNVAYRPEKIFFDIRHIKSLTVEKEPVYGKRFIDIITYDPPPKPLPGEIYIKGSLLNKRLN